MLSAIRYSLDQSKILVMGSIGPSDLGTKVLQNAKKSSLYCQSLLTHSHTMTPFDARGKQAF